MHLLKFTQVLVRINAVTHSGLVLVIGCDITEFIEEWRDSKKKKNAVAKSYLITSNQ
jgi:hypothetical protein